MRVDELIHELGRFPKHYEVRLLPSGEGVNGTSAPGISLEEVKRVDCACCVAVEVPSEMIEPHGCPHL